MGELDGRVGLVIGAGPGIGRACAVALAGAGADVAVVARRGAPLEALAAEVAAETGRRIVPIVADLADVDACRAAVDDTVARLGRVDAVVNVATHGGGRAPVAGLDWDDYRQAVDVNVIGTMEVSRTAVAYMARQGDGGAIVQISTLSVHHAFAQMSTYTSTKAAMMTASFTLAREAGPEGVRVNIVTPGYTTGDNLDAMFAAMGERTGTDGPTMSARAAKGAALRTHVDPEDIAEAVLFLVSPRGRYITGVELRVDAGQMVGS